MREVTFSLGAPLRLHLELEEAKFGLRPEDLFQLAVRQNTKRSFLFVSRVLGKHLSIRPSALLAAGKLLALAWLGQDDETGGFGTRPYSDLFRGAPAPFAQVWDALEHTRHTITPEERTLFLGFAETATGLARAVADCFDGELAYIDTTRLESPGPGPITFDESHSHARTHLLYLDGANPFLAGCQRVVLVDDELTTGNTALRLIRQLHSAFGIRRFTLMALLDNSDGENRRALEQELGVEIQAVSLLRGRIAGVESGALPPSSLTDLRGTPGETPALLDLSGSPLSGRRLLSAEDLSRQRERCREAASQLGSLPENTLCLGAGEFIYTPALITGLCGGGRFHSTTQSPVCPVPGSAITSGVRFDPPDRYSSAGYLYNVPQVPCPQAVIFAERETMAEEGLAQLTAYLQSRGVEKVTVCVL